jgi:uncharacterized protein YbbC (DUF1343 family)
MAKVALSFCFFVALTANCFKGDSLAATASPRQADSSDRRAAVRSSSAESPTPAAHHPETYLPKLAGKTLGLVVNQTSVLADGTHLVDTLLALGQDVRRIFAPEHGFRGSADAGAKVKDGIDTRTGLPIRSLYGRSKKPTLDDLSDIDLIVFDIQDVGARFYTYISTLHYVMESAARFGKPVLVLDRPNPNGHYVDGPVRQPGFASFVGLDPIPVVHGLTVGEYARMVNGEGWLEDDLVCELEVQLCSNYTHDTPYELPVPPSPNLPNQRSIYLYPPLCFFEGTALSVGRGTDKQFQLYGHPKLEGPYAFTPRPGPGSANPKLRGEACHGYDLSTEPAEAYRIDFLDLAPLLDTHAELSEAGETFFTRPEFFDLLAGSDRLRKQIVAGATEDQIRNSWTAELADFRKMRERYLIYP